MTKYLNDYIIKVLHKTWGEQSDDQRSILALATELQTIKEYNIQLSASVLRNIQKKAHQEQRGTIQTIPNTHDNQSVDKVHPPPSTSAIIHTTGAVATING